jgi:uncharacterized protein YukE
MAKKQVYNPEHLAAIASGYKECAEIAGNIITYSAAAKSTLETNYEGQGKSMAIDTFEKIKEHMNLIKLSIEVAGNYVSTTMADLQKMDAEIIQKP